ncbi:hypothetical protein BV25DRAFT_1831724 [Artomyces pyxidatus]|uniref:Uncharacterized protein n=1 Tax=Artomyces pyxidatus TaxID=48021 RepID=A0ACB8SL48_9AGAM|nr:hypothetical protein BV25DRAFT_1831724 [Artomyces pyxidatus]
MALVKLLLIFVAFCSYNVALTRPQSGPSKEEQAKTAKDKWTASVDNGTHLFIAISRVRDYFVKSLADLFYEVGSLVTLGPGGIHLTR